MRPSLLQEVEAFLRVSGPHRPTDIARNVRARRADVDRVLLSGPFARVPHPDGAEPNAKYFDLSERVPGAEAAILVPVRRGGESRQSLMLDVLRDGRWHSRRDLWDAAGKFFLTNNAAAELRGKGHNVVYDRGRDAYRLAPAAAMRAPRGVSVSGDAPSLKVVAA